MPPTLNKRPVPSLLSQSDFTDAPDPTPQSLCLICANTGEGKTTTSLLYTPGPIAFFDVNKRGFHAIKLAKERGKQIRYLSVDYPKNYAAMTDKQAIEAGQKSVDLVNRNWDICLRANQIGDIRTIVLDTATEFGEIVNISLVGRPERQSDDYGKSSSAQKTIISKMLKDARDTNVNVVLLTHVKEVYESSIGANGKPKREATGKFTFRGPASLLEDVDWAGHLRLQKVPVKQRGTDRSKKMEMEMIKAGVDRTQLGSVYKEDDWGDMGPFVYACVFQYPDSSPDDWME